MIPLQVEEIELTIMSLRPSNRDNPKVPCAIQNSTNVMVFDDIEKMTSDVAVTKMQVTSEEYTKEEMAFAAD